MIASNKTLEILLKTAEECNMSLKDINKILREIEARHKTTTSRLLKNKNVSRQRKAKKKKSKESEV